MSQSDFQDLVDVLRTTPATIAVVAIVAFFTTVAVVLWVWRGMALDEESQSTSDQR
jgi:hypothetical protein